MRITINVPDAVGRKIKREAKGGSVSGWLVSLAEEHLALADLDRVWSEFHASVAPGPADKRRARATLARLKKRPRSKKAA